MYSHRAGSKGLYPNDAGSRTGALYKTQLERAMHSLKKEKKQEMKEERERKREREVGRRQEGRAGVGAGVEGNSYQHKKFVCSV